MLLHWSLERITAPISALGIQRATWTEEVSTYRRQCREAGETPVYKAGIHYIVAGSRRAHSNGGLESAARFEACLVLGVTQTRAYSNVVVCEGASFCVLACGECSPPLRAHAALDLGSAPRVRHESFALEFGSLQYRLARRSPSLAGSYAGIGADCDYSSS